MTAKPRYRLYIFTKINYQTDKTMAIGSMGLEDWCPPLFRIRGLSPPKNSLSKHAS